VATEKRVKLLQLTLHVTLSSERCHVPLLIIHWQVVSVYSVATEKRVKLLQVSAVTGTEDATVHDISFRCARQDTRQMHDKICVHDKLCA